jgi:hypothetical protein
LSAVPFHASLEHGQAALDHFPIAAAPVDNYIANEAVKAFT